MLFRSEGVSYGHGDRAYPAADYRRNTGMCIFRRFPERSKRIVFDGAWAQYVLRMNAGDFACYTINEVTMHSGLEIACYSVGPSVIEVYQDDAKVGRFELSGTRYRQVLAGMQLENAERCAIRLLVTEGTVDVETLVTRVDE